MTNKPTIELPRIEGESARAYSARREYVLMGPQRSQEAVSKKLAKSRQLLSRWSTQYDWAGSARQYDEQISYITVQEAAEQYRADLADYRKRYGDTGKALLGVAMKMLGKMNRTLDTMPGVAPGNMALVSNAIKTAADLEALALRVENLLSDERSSEQSI